MLVSLHDTSLSRRRLPLEQDIVNMTIFDEGYFMRVARQHGFAFMTRAVPDVPQLVANTQD